MGEPHVPEQRDYEVRRGKPPVHRRFKKGQSGNPRPKNWPALLVEALNEPVVLTIEGAPRDHQARGGRDSAGNKSTSHSRPPMAQVHRGVIRRPEGAPAREKSAAILCHPGAGRDQFSRWESALHRCDEASGTGVKRLKDGALDHHGNGDKVDEGHLDFVGSPSITD